MNMHKLIAIAIATATAVFAFGTVSAAPPVWSTDLGKALSQAKKENKMGFILLGRENCGNCRAAKKLVNEGKVPVSEDTFVIAEIDTDDLDADEAFLKKFGRDNFGDVLPFVVITDSEGRTLAHYSGRKSQSDLTALIEGAKAKAAAGVK
jgi:hypothetical protein